MSGRQIHIPEGWIEKTLGDALKYEQPYKYAVSDTAYSNSSGTPVLTAGKTFILGYTNEAENIYSNVPVIIFDDFTTDSKFVDFPFKVKSSAMKFLKEKNTEDFSLKFVFEILQTLKLQSTGGDHKRRWISEYCKLKYASPPFKEQTRIAQILSAIDKAIAQTEALIAKYQRIKTGLMQDLLTHGIDENGDIRSEQTHRFKTEKGLRVPEEWEVVRLSYFIERLEAGVSVNGEDKPAGTGQFGVLKTSALSGCVFNPYQNKIVEDKEISRLKCPVKKGAIIISRMNTPELVGENALVETEHDNLFLPDRLWQTVYRNEEQLDVYWLSKIISSKKYRTRISFNASGTSGTMKNITKTDFMNILIPKPLQIEQEKISQILKAIFKRENRDLRELRKLQSLKTGLMQDLLSGKVRVKVSQETSDKP